MINNKCIERGLNCWSKIPCRSPTMSEILSSTAIQTLWPARIAMSSQERQIGAYSFWSNHLAGNSEAGLLNRSQKAHA
jgi:hypothetical protein